MTDTIINSIAADAVRAALVAAADNPPVGEIADTFPFEAYSGDAFVSGSILVHVDWASRGDDIREPFEYFIASRHLQLDDLQVDFFSDASGDFDIPAPAFVAEAVRRAINSAIDRLN